MIEFAEWLEFTPFSVTIQSVHWIIPLLQSIHIVMIGIVFVSILIVALRILGRVRTEQPFPEVWQRFAPWIWTALVIMAVTGLLLVAGEPVREFTSTSFWLKIALIVVAVVGAASFGRRAAAIASGAESELSSGSRTAAVATIALWLAIIFLGRAIAYDVEVWGALSLAARG